MTEIDDFLDDLEHIHILPGLPGEDETQVDPQFWNLEDPWQEWDYIWPLLSDQENATEELSALDLDLDLQTFLENFRHKIHGHNPENTLAFYLISLAYSAVILFGVSGNILVIVAVMSKSAMRNTHNFLIATLAISDLFLCCVSLPITLWELFHERWPFGPDTLVLCQAIVCAQVIPVFMSSMAIGGIAWDRYRSVVQNKISPFSGTSTILLCIGMAVLSLVLSGPLLFTATLEPLVNFEVDLEVSDILICRQSWSSTARVAYRTGTCLFQFIIPIGFVIYTNSCVVLRLSHRPPSQHPDLNERRRRTNQIIVGVTLVFFLSWLPLNLFRLLAEFGPLWIHPLVGGREELIFGMLNLLGATNACVNPILYGYFNENFRNEYRDIYKAMPWHRRRLSSPSPHPISSTRDRPGNDPLAEVVVVHGSDQQRSDTPASASSLSTTPSPYSIYPKLSHSEDLVPSQVGFQFHSNALVPPPIHQPPCARKSSYGGDQSVSTAPSPTTTTTLSWCDKDECVQSYASTSKFGSQSSPSTSSSLSSSSFTSASSSTIMWIPKGCDRRKSSSSAFIKVHPCSSSSTSLSKGVVDWSGSRRIKGDTNQIFVEEKTKQTGAKNSPRIQIERDLKSNIFVLFFLQQNVDETSV